MSDGNDNLVNPHAAGLEHDIWEMCVRRDLIAFLTQDWSIIAKDYNQEEFLGIDSCGSVDPLDWIPKYSTLDAYRVEFESQADSFANKEFVDDPLIGLGSCLTLSKIKQQGDRMLVVKVFDGDLPLIDGTTLRMKWKSLFHLKCNAGTWRFSGFVGYLPL